MRDLERKNCLVCGKQYLQPYSCSKNAWKKRITCSRDCNNKYWIGKPNGRKKQGSKNSVPAWNKGSKGLMPEPWNKGKGDYARVLGFGKWMTGKKLSVETRMKQSQTHQRRIVEGKHNFYIDGRTHERARIRHSINYRL